MPLIHYSTLALVIVNSTKAFMKLQSYIGKVAIVTGGNRGLGLETTRILSSGGCKVYITARSLDQGKQALESIK